MLAVTRCSALTACATLLAFASCNPATAPSGDGRAHLAVRADVSGTAVTTVVVEVSAADLPQRLVFNFIVANGVASGTITIPAGTGRTITIRAFDAGGVETHGCDDRECAVGTQPDDLRRAHPIDRAGADRGY